VLVERRGARLLATVVNVIVGVLGLLGAVAVYTLGGRDPVLTTSLVLVAVLLLTAAAVLLRRR
jgi:hypothetical protein